MRTIPTSVELLEIVSEYLRTTVSAKLPAPDNFYALIAANSIDIVRREIAQGPAADAAARGRLCDLLGAAGSLEELDTRLIAGLADGSIALDAPGLVEHLVATTLDEVAIDQPKYASVRRLQERASTSQQ